MADRHSNGVLVGRVESLDDPDGLGRVKVIYPTLQNQLSAWARLVTPMAGQSRGIRFAPEKGEQVLVVWDGGDPRQPYVLGGLWNTEDPPPPDDGNTTENNHRTIVSRSGHVVRLDDTNGAEKVEVIDQSGQLRLVLDSSAGSVIVEAGQSRLEMDAMGSISLAGTDITIEAIATLTLTGGQVTIN